MKHTSPLARFLLVTTALVVTSSAASAQSATPSGKSRFGSADRAFVMKTAMANNYELASARLAQRMTTAAEDQTYAQQIIDDHTKVGDQLKAAVAEAAPSVTLPTGTDAKGTARLAKLEKAGPRFAATYRQQMIASHQEIHDMFQSYIVRTSVNAGVKSVIAGAQPTVVMHWNAAKKLPSR